MNEAALDAFNIVLTGALCIKESETEVDKAVCSYFNFSSIILINW